MERAGSIHCIKNSFCQIEGKRKILRHFSEQEAQPLELINGLNLANLEISKINEAAKVRRKNFHQKGIKSLKNYNSPLP